MADLLLPIRSLFAVPSACADYKKLGVLKQQFPDTPIIALTATATAQASCGWLWRSAGVA